MNRTGDGRKMGVWAGGEIELTTHTKMIHDARVGRVDTPHLLVNAKGERFMCEGPMQGYLNNYVREYIHEAGGDAKAGNLYTIVDAKWQDQIAEWKAIDPEIDASNCKWFYEGNTIEEACAAMAAVMTGSSSFPYSLISVTVCDPRRIREFALSSSPAAMAVAPARFATVFTLPEKDWSNDTIITAAITPRLTLDASFKSGRSPRTASRSSSISPAAKEPVSSGISSAPFSGTCGAVNSTAEAGIASANINATAKISLLIILVKSPVSVPAWR